MFLLKLTGNEHFLWLEFPFQCRLLKSRGTSAWQVPVIPQIGSSSSSNSPFPIAHHVVNEAGISQAMLLHLHFHNKWLSPGKPKYIKLSIRAAWAICKPWLHVCQQHGFSSHHSAALPPPSAKWHKDHYPNIHPIFQEFFCTFFFFFGHHSMFKASNQHDARFCWSTWPCMSS